MQNMSFERYDDDHDELGESSCERDEQLREMRIAGCWASLQSLFRGLLNFSLQRRFFNAQSYESS